MAPKFSDGDAARVRPLCKACIYGEDRQTTTDRHRIPSFVNVGSLMTPSAVAFNTDPNAWVIGMRHDIVSRKLLELLVPDMPAPESTIQLTE